MDLSFIHGGRARADLGNGENVGQAGEIAHKVGCIGVIISSTGPYKTLQDIMVFCAVILSIGLDVKKEYFMGSVSILTTGLGLLYNYLIEKVGIARVLNGLVYCP
ncbi:hypothetical protein [Microcoleus sp. Pol12A6]|uniref:hypothetical protein n=1 Tax=Microcoleus sp. Pol12A6 TaxID=3055393 RepID=UPI002FD5A362